MKSHLNISLILKENNPLEVNEKEIDDQAKIKDEVKIFFEQLF